MLSCHSDLSGKGTNALGLLMKNKFAKRPALKDQRLAGNPGDDKDNRKIEERYKVLCVPSMLAWIILL